VNFFLSRETGADRSRSPFPRAILRRAVDNGILATALPWALWAAIGVGGALGAVALVRSRGAALAVRAGLRAALSTDGEGALSPRDAFLVSASMSALPVVVGTATAIAVGGPGAVLWLWIGAVLLAGLRWLDVGFVARHQGAPKAFAATIGKRFPSLSFLYAFVGLLAAALAGSALAGLTVAGAAADAGMPARWVALALGAVGLAVGLLGAARVIAVARMASAIGLAIVVVAALAAIVGHPARLGSAIGRVFSEGLSGSAPSGGFIGAFLVEAVRSGLGLGLAPTAAAFGPAATVQSEASHADAASASRAGAVEPLLSVLLVSILVALPILTSRAWNTPGPTSIPLREAIALTHTAASPAEADDPERRFSLVTRWREGETLDRIEFLGGRGMLQEVTMTDRGRPLDAAFTFDDGHVVKLQMPRKTAPGRRRVGTHLEEVPLARVDDIVLHGTGLRRGASLVAAAFEDGLPRGWGGPVTLAATLLLALSALCGWTMYARRAASEVAEPGAARMLAGAAGAAAGLAAVPNLPWLLPTAAVLVAVLALLHGLALAADLTGRAPGG